MFGIITKKTEVYEKKIESINLSVFYFKIEVDNGIHEYEVPDKYFNDFNIGDQVFYEKRNQLNRLVERLSILDIKIELGGNIPWIYADKINGTKVTEKFDARHGFTFFFMISKEIKSNSLYKVKSFRFSDRREVFNLIRKYINKEKQ